MKTTVVYVMFIYQGQCKFKARIMLDCKKSLQMVSNVFFVNQAAQAYNIYQIIYVCVGNYGS